MNPALDPNCRPRDWYAIGQVFSEPFTFENPGSGDPCAQNFGVSVGVQVLAAMDVASQYMLTGTPVHKLPGYLTAKEVIDFMDSVFSKHGKPRVGVILGDSVFSSSHELLLDEVTRPRGEWLREMEIEIPPMPESEKQAIEKQVRSLGLEIKFGEE